MGEVEGGVANGDLGGSQKGLFRIEKSVRRTIRDTKRDREKRREDMRKEIVYVEILNKIGPTDVL